MDAYNIIVSIYNLKMESMQTKMFILILMLFCVARVEGESLLGSSLNRIKTVQLNLSQELKVKIEPHQQLILNLNLQNMTGKIEFDISSTASYQICTLNSQKECSKNYVRHSKKDNSFIFSRQQITNGIKIKNPSITNKIKVVINYHAEIQQCHRLESRVLHRKQLKLSSCFLFQLDKQQDVELIIIKEQILDLKYQIQVCSKEYQVTQQNFSNNKFKLNFIEIIKLCKQSSNMTLKIIITHKDQNTTQYNNNPHIGLLLEYLQQSLLLPDGIAYTTSFTDHLNAKVFEYQLLNKQNTTINVISDLSLQIYAKVVEHSDKDETIPNKINCDFSSKTGFIFTYFRPYLLITKDVLQKYKCKDCYLVVSVWKNQDLDQADKKNKFSIQITQHSSTLIDGQMKHHFLQTGAFAYYTFNSQTDSLTVYELADNNKNCAMFYLSDEEVPGPENYLKKSQKNKIMYKSDSNKPIFIGVKATSDCTYSISATSASTQLITLQKGRFANLNLMKDEIRYFIIQAAKCEYIKLLSLHIYGSVDIYLNRTDIAAIKRLKKDKIDYTKFNRKGQYMNRLVLSSKDEIFCEGCFYLVAVVAKKLTQSTLFYGDESTLIPIHEKTINDIIPTKGNKVKGEYFGSFKFQLQVKIHSGKLRLSISKGKQKFTQIYSTINVIKKQVVDLGSNSFLLFSASVFNLQTVEVLFEALEDNTIYSIRFNPIEEGILSSLSKLFKPETQVASNNLLAKIQTYSLQPGHDLYLRISDQQTTIVSGYFRDSAEKILLSSNIDESQLFSQLNLTLSVDGKSIQYKLQKMRNILTLQIPKLINYSIKQGIKYNLTITLNSTGSFWLTIMQAEDFQLLSPHIYTHIHNSFTFVTHTQSDLIVELFQCKGRASLVYASERQKLDTNQNKTLDIIGLPNQPHALRISRLSTTFYKVTAQQAILRWFPFKMQDGIGTGYIDYKAGSLLYESTITNIKFNWLSLSLVNGKNKTQARGIENIYYAIYIAASLNRLTQLSQCQPFLITDKEQGIKIKNIVEFSQSKKLNKTLSYTISKQQLLTKFGQNITLYATIAAELILSSNSTKSASQKQRYRFIYPQIQIPYNLLHSSYIATVIESNYDQLISAVLVVIAAIVISTYFLVNKLMPVLGRLKNRYFVQENEQIDLPVQNVVPSENDNQQVPQSSDRREVAGTGQRIEIQEKS